YNAACAAALASAGRGADAGPLDEKERAGWGKQALEWLRAELAAVRKVLESGKPEERSQVRRRLQHWQRDPALAGLRDPASVARLPVSEQEACKQLWVEVEAWLTDPGAAR